MKNPTRRIEIWLMAAFLVAAAQSFGAENPETIVQGIDREIQHVNSQLSQGHAIQQQPNCSQWGICEFITAFSDSQGRIRKIIEWSEGDRQAMSKSVVAMRSIWEWYYDTEGQPIFVDGRYEGEPGSGWLQEHTVYIVGGHEIRGLRADGRIAPFQPEPPAPRDDVVDRARTKLQAAKLGAFRNGGLGFQHP